MSVLSRPVRRTAAAIVAGAASAALLAGCSLFSTDYPRAELDIPDSVSEPDTELELGEGARILDANLESEIGFSILHIEEGETSIYDDLSNPEDFEDYTPIWLIVQYEEVDGSTEWTAPAAQFESGDFAEYLSVSLTGFGGWDADDLCPASFEEGNEEDGYELMCMIFLVPEGETLDRIGWFGYHNWEGVASFGDAEGDEAYYENPVFWAVP